jgi:hypothetical protein
MTIIQKHGRIGNRLCFLSQEARGGEHKHCTRECRAYVSVEKGKRWEHCIILKLMHGLSQEFSPTKVEVPQEKRIDDVVDSDDEGMYVEKVNEAIAYLNKV